MLIQVESSREKKHAQAVFEDSLRKAWPNAEERRVIWRPSGRDIDINHNGELWFASWGLTDTDTAIHRNWTPFGVYHASGNLEITVEVNIPTTTNSKKVSGFFARDPEGGAIYLMHDGGVGGGRKGIGRTAFLAWTDTRLFQVTTSDGGVRLGMVVTRIDSPDVGVNISRFVKKVIGFKNAVARGEAATTAGQDAEKKYREYYDEFSGKKHRAPVSAVEYLSRHGDIVRALCNWRSGSLVVGESIVKNIYLDMGIKKNAMLTEVYEVKTSCDRQTLYAAIGQVIVHDNLVNNSCRRCIVLPIEGAIPPDIASAFGRERIRVLRFDLQQDGVQISV